MEMDTWKVLHGWNRCKMFSYMCLSTFYFYFTYTLEISVAFFCMLFGLYYMLYNIFSGTLLVVKRGTFAN